MRRTVDSNRYRASLYPGVTACGVRKVEASWSWSSIMRAGLWTRGIEVGRGGTGQTGESGTLFFPLTPNPLPLLIPAANEVGGRSCCSAEVIQAYEAIHHLGIIHGDREMRHLRTRPDGGVWILDFDCAKVGQEVECEKEMRQVRRDVQWEA